jgi:hypothetical protein
MRLPRLGQAQPLRAFGSLSSISRVAGWAGRAPGSRCLLVSARFSLGLAAVALPSGNTKIFDNTLWAYEGPSPLPPSCGRAHTAGF